ncbi:DUF6241 domain-containing protein [Candidatus Clostridium radicumherbarum]|uniref:DUF6241 domain-containing protein n=1 Tax=Candidatus Clostridium radicumherbarum TaxID=3381662 RepID=A0ABW8TT50_9CLOT
MNKYFKWGIIAASITLVIGGVALFIGILIKPNHKDAQVKQETPTYAETKSIKQGTDNLMLLKIGGQEYDLHDRDRVLRLIHEMTHTKVEAEVSNRYVEITPDRVDALILAISNTDWKDKDYLLDNLNKWKGNDFSNSVDVHNYIWQLEGGETGKATALKKDSN